MQAKQFWTKAYQRNIGKMVGVCCRYVGDRAVAEDLAHEAFLKAIEKSGTYRRLGSVGNIIATVIGTAYLTDKSELGKVTVHGGGKIVRE